MTTTADKEPRSALYLAELAIDNGECGAQMEIKDQILRESLSRNVEKVIANLIKRETV